MQIDYVRILIEGQEVCIARRAMVSAYMVVAEKLQFVDAAGADFFARLKEGEKFPVIAYLADEREKVAGEAFMYPQTHDRLHIGVWRTYVLDLRTNKWEV